MSNGRLGRGVADGHVGCFGGFETLFGALKPGQQHSAQGVFDDMGLNIPILLKDASPVTHLGASSSWEEALKPSDRSDRSSGEAKKASEHQAEFTVTLPA